jgi:hypothetical protein
LVVKALAYGVRPEAFATVLHLANGGLERTLRAERQDGLRGVVLAQWDLAGRTD